MAKVSLEDTYTYHPPFGDQTERYQALRAEGLKLAKLGTDLTPPSREQSLGLTFVQQAVQMFNAAIAIHEKQPVVIPAAEPVTAEPVATSQEQN